MIKCCDGFGNGTKIDNDANETQEIHTRNCYAVYSTEWIEKEQKSVNKIEESSVDERERVWEDRHLGIFFLFFLSFEMDIAPMRNLSSTITIVVATAEQKKSCIKRKGIVLSVRVFFFQLYLFLFIFIQISSSIEIYFIYSKEPIHFFMCFFFV